jgi:hypothetical protein
MANPNELPAQSLTDVSSSLPEIPSETHKVPGSVNNTPLNTPADSPQTLTVPSQATETSDGASAIPTMTEAEPAGVVTPLKRPKGRPRGAAKQSDGGTGAPPEDEKLTKLEEDSTNTPLKKERKVTPEEPMGEHVYKIQKEYFLATTKTIKAARVIRWGYVASRAEAKLAEAVKFDDADPKAP